MIDDLYYKKTESLDNYMIKREREILLDKYVPLVQGMLSQDYDNMLSDVVNDIRSKTNPAYIKKDFSIVLERFEYVKRYDSGTVFSVPDMTNFPFEFGRLQIIKQILEGTPGVYVEVSEEQFLRMYGKKPIQLDPYDSTVPNKDRIYLLRYTSDVQRKEFDTFKGTVLVRFPFSNTPPIRLFDPVNKFVEENFDKWVEYIVNTAQKEFLDMEKVK